MGTELPAPAPLAEDPHAQMEKAFIEEYLKGQGHTLESVRKLPEAQAKHLLTEASVYASAKLSEVEMRAHFVDDVHGVSPPLG